MSPEQAVTHALGYPYPRPSISFIFPCDGSPPALSASAEASILSDPSLNFVVVIGSNAAPSRLLAKFGSSCSPIPVLAIHISGIDVAHSACMSSYGSIPATILPCPGAVLATHATILKDEQLAMMNATEVGYLLVQLRTDLVRMNSGLPLRSNTKALAYVWQGGPLRAPDGFPRALTMIKAQGRMWTEWDQRKALKFVMETAVTKGVTAKDESLETFVLRNLEDETRRNKINDVMREEWKGAKTLDSDGFWEVLKLL